MDLVAAKVLRKVLANFTKQTADSKEEVSVGTSSRIVLKEVELKEDVVGDLLKIPPALMIEQARCRLIEVEIPSMTFDKPITVRVEGVFVRAAEGAAPVIPHKQGVKKPKKKTKRQILDTVLIAVEDCSLEVRFGETTLCVALGSLHTFFADHQFQKVETLVKERPQNGRFLAYRVAEVRGFNLALRHATTSTDILRNINVNGRITQVRDETSYCLLETHLLLNVNRLRVMLTTEQYLLATRVLRKLIVLYTKSFHARPATPSVTTPQQTKNVKFTLGAFELTVKDDVRNEAIRLVSEHIAGTVLLKTGGVRVAVEMTAATDMVNGVYEVDGVGKQVVNAYGKDTLKLDVRALAEAGELEELAVALNVDGLDVCLETVVVERIVAFIRTAVIDKLRGARSPGDAVSTRDTPAKPRALPSFVRTAERLALDVHVRNCTVSAPFPMGGGCNVHVSEVELTTRPKFDVLATNKTMRAVLGRDGSPTEETRRLRVGVGVGGVRVEHVDTEGKRVDIVTPIRAVASASVSFFHSKIPVSVVAEASVNQFSVLVSNATLLACIEYFRSLSASLNTILAPHVAEAAEAVKAKSTSLVETITAFVSRRVLPLIDHPKLPHLALSAVLKRLDVSLPMTTLLTNDSANSSSALHAENISLLVAADAADRGFLCFLDTLATPVVEPVLAPLRNVVTHPAADHAVSVAVSFPAGALLEPRSVQLRVMLLGVDVVFGAQDASPLPELLRRVVVEEKQLREIQRDVVNEVRKARKTAQRKEVALVRDWLRTLYHGFRLAVEVSDCAFTFETNEETLSFDTHSKLAAQGKALEAELTGRLVGLQMENNDLVMQRDGLLQQLKRVGY